MAHNIYLASKPRYEILDGLRGVAAIIVLIFHLFETYSNGLPTQIINHGYLAVDFFFVLSGFVVGYAYDDRWDKMSTWNFFKRRLVRLHPLLVFGTLLGAALFFISDGTPFPNVSSTSLGMFLLVLLMGCLMLPTPLSMDIRGWQDVSPLNGSAWSLMWEYVANIVYALFLRKCSRTMIAILTVLAACLTADVALNLDITGLLSTRSSSAYSVVGGWALSPTQLYIGATRLLYPFLAGLLLSRIGRYIKLNGGFWWSSMLIALVLICPYIGGAELNIYDGIYQLICILIVFPIIVAIGAGSEVHGQTSESVCKLLGEISYPLYIVHLPIVYVFMSWASRHADAPMWHHVAAATGTFFISIAVAYASLRLYDEPIRKWLKERIFSTK